VRLRHAGAALAATFLLAGCGSTGVPEAGDAGAGEELFTQKCGSCHTLEDAGTQGRVGPNLDAAFERSREDGFDESTFRGVVRNMIEYPVPPMPERETLELSEEDADNIATYVASVAGHGETAGGGGGATTAGEEPAAGGAGGDGKSVFAKAGCGSCHTFADAGSTGTIGPNLDDTKPSKELAIDRVTNGSGAMPPFKGQLSDAEIEAVAEYVSGG
jgi:mono/diheme cytochrome c family protein